MKKIHWIATFCALAFAGSANASLGGDAASISLDQSAMQAGVTTNAGTGYTEYVLALAGGGTVHEYLSGAGQVFAVSWHGPRLPNLQALLGSYFSTYTTTQQRRGPVLVHQSDIVIEASGHMGSFHGHAYLPDAVPAGVIPKSLR